MTAALLSLAAFVGAGFFSFLVGFVFWELIPPSRPSASALLATPTAIAVGLLAAGLTWSWAGGAS